MRKSYSKFLFLFTAGWLFITSLSAQECNIIYITPSGASSGSAGTVGTVANPAKLSFGLTLVTGNAKQLWLAVGTYPISNTLTIPSNVTIEGGFNTAGWVKSNVAQTIIDKDINNFLPSPANALVGLAGNAVTNFRLQDITVNVAGAPGNGISVYGIYLSGCSNYSIVRCTVTTGAGSDGLAGTPGTAATQGGGGNPGNPGNPNQNPQPGGTGGIGGGGANNGGNGASGGQWNGSVGPGLPGLPSGCGGTGGTTGSGPNCSPFCGSCSDASPGAPGTAGQIGAAGISGTAGAPGAITLGYFAIGTAGGAGTAGTAGCGGGGGGGGGGDRQSGNDGVGGSGGGGGGGGDGGLGGTGGGGGGGSFAVFLYNNGTGGIIQDCFLNQGTGGAGGPGGAGSIGGVGGAGGIGGAGDCAQENGAAGGNGGAGGIGGAGGSGAAGTSTALSENGGTLVSNLGIAAVPGNPPVISVASKGCTNSEVVFSSVTSGTWNFGAGASPATATGTGPFSVYYSSMGRKDITFSGTIFSGYINIFQPGPITPSITPANGTVTLGCPNNFTTSLAGTYYEWIFGSSATPDTMLAVQSPTNVYFFSPGTHTIYVYVTTACCGRVLDSTTVTVTPSNFNVTLTASPTQSCIGDPITFTASMGSPPFAGFSFFVNNASAQSGPSNTFTTSSLMPGDSIVVIAIAGTCYTNPSAVYRPVISPIPVVSLISGDADSTICEGDNILFIALPAGYTSYNFFDNGVSVQNSTSISYSTTTLQPGNSITVVATNLGCVSLPSNAKVTTVNLTPVTVLTSSDTSNILCGPGNSVTFTASPAGFANYQFFDGGNSVQNGAGNTYTTNTLAAGNSISVIATSAAGCVGPTSNAIATAINPIPTAVLSSSDADNTICQNASITFTSTPAGYGNYHFFNNGVSIQNGVSNTYTTTTLAAGNSITVVAADLGCSSPVSNAIITTIIPAPLVNAGPDFTVCINIPPYTLTGFTPANGVWTGSGITNAGLFNPAAAGAGIHKLIYAFTNVSNCTGYDTLNAAVIPIPVISVSPAAPAYCAGGAVMLTASGANTYIWSPAAGLSASTGASVSASPPVTTTYKVIGSSFGCIDSTTTTVTFNLVPSVTISGNTTIDACESTVLTAMSTSAGTYSWGPLINMTCITCQSATVSPPASQKYYVDFISPQGCIGSDTVLVNVVSIFNYFMPTGFTPNGDGRNDSVHVHGRGIESVDLKIYDRIGEKVFETTDIHDGWDGKYHDVEMNDGVFVYMVEIKYCNGQIIKEQGNLTLVR